MLERRGRLAACLLLVAVACHRRDTGDEIVVTSATCIPCAPAAAVGALESKEIDETSGIAPSSVRDDVYFVNNDSGDVARFFAIDLHGRRLATYSFSPRGVSDCEEITRGPCDAGGAASCLYVGDVGDNLRTRDTIDVYRVVEPTGPTLADATLPSDRFPFRYPDGSHDAEIVLVHPRTAALTIVTKERSGVSGIYDAPMPLTPGRLATLVKAGTVRSPAGSPRFTGASVRPDARGILLRTYTHVFFAPMRPEQTIAAALAAPLCSLPVAKEEQGEAISWLRDGQGFVTLGEGAFARLNVTRCQAP